MLKNLIENLINIENPKKTIYYLESKLGCFV